jgi:uncharacterized membrane protein
MADTPQTYANHTRWHAAFHFFVVPVMLINVVWQIIVLVKNPGREQVWAVVVAIALAVIGSMTRTNALKVQDRVIRLEEQIRYRQLLPADLIQQGSRLTLGQTIALRFASDEELAGLVREVLAGRLTKPAEIKQAIRNWRADTLRV